MLKFLYPNKAYPLKSGVRSKQSLEKTSNEEDNLSNPPLFYDQEFNCDHCTCQKYDKCETFHSKRIFYQ